MDAAMMKVLSSKSVIKRDKVGQLEELILGHINLVGGDSGGRGSK